MNLIFNVLGKPYGKQRPRYGKYGIYDPQTNKAYEKRVKAAFYDAAGHHFKPVSTPVALIITIYFQPPKSVSKQVYHDMIDGKVYPTHKPDIDNCVKSIMDGLNGVAYEDDKQVVAIVVNKAYSTESKVTINFGEV